jgi:hypothetical protein
MKLQQWGTFSVKDHVKARAFVAEVLLFDRLVIPRPATEKEMKAEGLGPPSEDEVERWRNRNWFPERQRELLDILGEYDLAIELPWGRQAQAHWQGVYGAPDVDPAESDLSASRKLFTIRSCSRNGSRRTMPHISRAVGFWLYMSPVKCKTIWRGKSSAVPRFPVRKSSP